MKFRKELKVHLGLLWVPFTQFKFPSGQRAHQGDAQNLEKVDYVLWTLKHCFKNLVMC